MRHIMPHPIDIADLCRILWTVNTSSVLSIVVIRSYGEEIRMLSMQWRSELSRQERTQRQAFCGGSWPCGKRSVFGSCKVAHNVGQETQQSITFKTNSFVATTGRQSSSIHHEPGARDKEASSCPICQCCRQGSDLTPRLRYIFAFCKQARYPYWIADV